jgi:general stress protein 26
VARGPLADDAANQAAGPVARIRLRRLLPLRLPAHVFAGGEPPPRDGEAISGQNVPMPLTNPWLAGPTPDRDLPLEQLQERILQLLSTHNTAVVATVNEDGSPTATPVRYYNLGFEIFYTSWNASRKSRNLRRDPRVSAGIVAPLVGQASSRGAQLFGTARTLERDDPEAERYWEAFRWQSDHAEQGLPLNAPPTDPLTIITPDRILYTEHWLRREGYRPRHTWHRS